MTEKEWIVPDHLWRIADLFRLLQDTAEEAVIFSGASGSDLEKKGLMWVVVRYQLVLNKALEPDQILHIKTWASPFRHMISQRHYLITDSQGKELATAAGLWAVAARDTRSMVDPAAYGVSFPTEYTERELPRPQPPLRIPFTGEKLLVISDSFLDSNRHMNNTCYFTVCEDCIDGDTDGLRLCEVRSVFMEELLSGDNLLIQWGREGNNWCFSGKKGDKESFRISFHYKEVGSY